MDEEMLNDVDPEIAASILGDPEFARYTEPGQQYEHHAMS